MPKSRRFDSLATTSGIQGRVLVDNCPVGMPPALCPLSVQPYGQDPVFNPFSEIFDDSLPGLEGNYYNTTTVGWRNCQHADFQQAVLPCVIKFDAGLVPSPAGALCNVKQSLPSRCPPVWGRGMRVAVSHTSILPLCFGK